MTDDEEAPLKSIAFILPSLGGGGAEIVAARWIESLRTAGNRVDVFTYGGHDVNGAVSSGSNHFGRYSRVARLLLLPVWIRSRVIASGAQYVVSSLTFTNLVVLGALRVLPPADVRVLISERSVLSLATRHTPSGRVKRWLAWLLYRRADGVIAISHPVAADLLRYGVRPDRLFVVPNPVSSTGVVPPARSRPNHSEIHLVYVGRFVEQKRPVAVLDVARRLADHGYRARVTMIGVGELREQIERRAQAVGVDLAIVGWREEWWSAVPDATCLVLPSLVEGFGNVLVEAASVGIPVVASSQALGVADAVVPGVTGELAITGSVDDLMDAVLRAIRAESFQEATTKWLERFSLDRSAEMFATVLGRLDHGAASA